MTIGTSEFPQLWQGWLTGATSYVDQIAKTMCPDPAREAETFVLASPLGHDATVAELREELPTQLAVGKALDYYRCHPDQITDRTLADITLLSTTTTQLGLLGVQLYEIQRTRLQRYSLRMPEVITSKMLAEERAKVEASGWPQDILTPVLNSLGAAEADHDRVPRFADAAMLAQAHHFAKITPGVTVVERPFMDICEPPYESENPSLWIHTRGDCARSCWGDAPTETGDAFFWREVLRSAGYKNPDAYPPLIEMRIDLRELPEEHHLMVLSSWQRAAASRIQGALENRAVMAFFNEEEGILILREIVPSVLEMALRRIYGNKFHGFVYSSELSTPEERCDDIKNSRYRVALLWDNTEFEDYSSIDGVRYPQTLPINITIHDEYHGVDQVLSPPSHLKAVSSLVKALGSLNGDDDRIWGEAAKRLLMDLEASAKYPFDVFIEEKVICAVFMYSYLRLQIQAIAGDEAQRRRFIFFWDQLRDARYDWRGKVTALVEAIHLPSQPGRPVLSEGFLQVFLQSLSSLKHVIDQMPESRLKIEMLSVVDKWQSAFSVRLR